jgi:hypothetical protein
MFARSDIACTVDTDCCVVTDDCTQSAVVVSAADKDTVANLYRSADMNRCTACIAQLVEVACQSGVCVGTLLDFPGPGGGNPDPRLAADHCGSINSSLPPKSTGSIFGCGPRP